MGRDVERPGVQEAGSFLDLSSRSSQPRAEAIRFAESERRQIGLGLGLGLGLVRTQASTLSFGSHEHEYAVPATSCRGRSRSVLAVLERDALALREDVRLERA